MPNQSHPKVVAPVAPTDGARQMALDTGQRLLAQLVPAPAGARVVMAKFNLVSLLYLVETCLPAQLAPHGRVLRATPKAVASGGPKPQFVICPIYERSLCFDQAGARVPDPAWYALDIWAARPDNAALTLVVLTTARRPPRAALGRVKPVIVDLSLTGRTADKFFLDALHLSTGNVDKDDRRPMTAAEAAAGVSLLYSLEDDVFDHCSPIDDVHRECGRMAILQCKPWLLHLAGWTEAAASNYAAGLNILPRLKMEDHLQDLFVTTILRELAGKGLAAQCRPYIRLILDCRFRIPDKRQVGGAEYLITLMKRMRQRGRATEARAILEQALATLSDAERTADRGRLLRTIGAFYAADVPHSALGLRYLRKARRAAEQIGDLAGEAETWCLLASDNLNLDQARLQLELAQKLAERVGTPEVRGAVLIQRAALEDATGQPGTAAALLREALTVYELGGQRESLSAVKCAEGILSVRRGSFAKGEALFREGESLAEDCGLWHDCLRHFRLMGEAEAEANRPTKALALWRQGIDMAKVFGDEAAAAELSRLFCATARATGRALKETQTSSTAVVAAWAQA